MISIMSTSKVKSHSSKRIAVVGSGIAGLGAARELHLAGHAVTVFEANDYLGGHAHTVDISIDDKNFGVDTGFLVFNHRTYPELLKLFAQLDVTTAASDMGFSVQVLDATKLGAITKILEWAGNNLRSVFAQPSNLLRPSFWGMLSDIVRFNKLATQLADQNSEDDSNLETVQSFLDRQNFGTAFRNHYLLPMIACIWSCPTDQMLAFPIQTLVRFCHNHGLLQIANRPQWYTVRGGSREYVQKITSQLADVRVSTPIIAINRTASNVNLLTARGLETFDALVLATHSDQALQLLGSGATALERQVLSSIGYQNNTAVLHLDDSVMPANRQAWAAWNYEHHQEMNTPSHVCLHYWLNALQPLPTQTPVFVSLNPLRTIDESKIIQRFDYAHPVFDQAAIAAQALLPKLHSQGDTQHTWFAGAWTKYGFHEDGLRSGLEAARALLASLKVSQ